MNGWLQRKKGWKESRTRSTPSLSELAPKEKEIERCILEWLNAQPGCKAWKNKSTGTYDPVRKCFRQNHSRWSEKGTSDILGIWAGKMLCIEVKSKRGTLRPEQKEFLTRMSELGAIAFVARSLDDVIEWLSQI